MKKFNWGKSLNITKTDKSIQDYNGVKRLRRINIDADREFEEKVYRFQHEHFKEMMSQAEL